MKISIEDKGDQLKFIIEGTVPISKRASKAAIVKLIAEKNTEFNNSMSQGLFKIIGPSGKQADLWIGEAHSDK